MRTIQYYYNKDKEISSKMVSEAVLKTKKSPSAVYMWMRGERIPCHLEQECLQQIVKKYYNESVPLSELFSV